MAMLWYPNQDVDFLRRLEALEREVKNSRRQQPISEGSFAEENKDLRIRIDDLEELVINLSETIAELQARN